MGIITDKYNEVYRDFNTDGVAASGLHEIDKADARTIGPLIEAAVGNAALSGLIEVVEATEADLSANVAPEAGTVALVYADPDSTNNDLWIKTGAAGSGPWTNSGILAGAIGSIFARSQSSVPFPTWLALQGAAGFMEDGDRAIVSAVDTGTHTDPVAGAGALNAGVYEKQAGHADPVRVGDLDSQTAAAFATTAGTYAGTSTVQAGIATAAANAALAASIDAEKRGKPWDTNIFNPADFTAGSGIRVSDGAVISGINALYGCSGFIRVDPSSFIATLEALAGPSGTYGGAFYSTPNVGSFVAGSGFATLAAAASLATGATANYVRVTTNLRYQTHIVRGATPPTAFRAFEPVDTFTARAASLARIKSLFGSSRNLISPAGCTEDFYINSSGVYTANNSYWRSNVIEVSPGLPYICNKSNGAGTYNKWVDSGGLMIGPAFQFTAGVAVTSPVAAAGLEVSGLDAANDPLLGSTAATKITMGVYQSATLPTTWAGFGATDPASAEVIARNAVRREQHPKKDLFSPRAITPGYLLAATGVASVQASYFVISNIPLTPGKGICFNADFVPGSATYAVNWYNNDLVRIGAAMATGVVADIATGQFTLNVTNVGTAGPLLIGLPISMTGVPARSWISGVPAGGPGTVGVYTFTNDGLLPATATTTGGALTAGGYLARVPIMPPPGAAHAAASGLVYMLEKFVVTDEAITGGIVAPTQIYSAPGLIGLRDSARRQRWAGLNFGGTGDSKTVDAQGNNAYWAMLEHYTRANGTLWAGGSGRRMYQALDGGGGGTYGRGSTSALVAGDFASLALFDIAMGTNDAGIRNTGAGTTGDPQLIFPFKDCSILGAMADTWTPTAGTFTTTSGATTLSAISTTRGSLQNGMPLRGPNLPLNCTLVDLGGGAWGLSANATGTGAAAFWGGTLYADCHWVLGQVLSWMAASTAPIKAVTISGPDQRFDDFVNHGNWTGVPGNPLNGRGYHLTDVRDVLRNIANYYSLPFWDAHAELGVNRYNYTSYFSDGLHDILLCYETLKGPRKGTFLNSI